MFNLGGANLGFRYAPPQVLRCRMLRTLSSKDRRLKVWVFADTRSEAGVNAADDSRSGTSRLLCGRAVRNGWGLCNHRQEQHPLRSSSFREVVVARGSSVNYSDSARVTRPWHS